MHIKTRNSIECPVRYTIPKDLDRRIGRTRRIVFGKK
jgi:hypothetical protein